MQLDLRHVAERNAKRYRENLSYLRGYDAGADPGRPLPPSYQEKAGWVWAVERVRADLKAKAPEKERSSPGSIIWTGSSGGPPAGTARCCGCPWS